MRFASGKWRWALGFFALGAAYLVAVYVLPGAIDQSDGQEPTRNRVFSRHSGRCTNHLRVPVERGEHKGQSWSVIASIENDQDCGAWLLKMRFLPQNVMPGSWEGGWEIPSGGHLPDWATISARDEATGEDRVISGVVGMRVRTVVFRTRSGHRVVVHPKAPKARLRKRFGWLRNLRYFLRFYPKGDPVRTAKLLDGRGKIIASFQCQAGEITGNMSLPL